MASSAWKRGINVTRKPASRYSLWIRQIELARIALLDYIETQEDDDIAAQAVPG
jgi:hypothetical protein